MERGSAVRGHKAAPLGNVGDCVTFPGLVMVLVFLRGIGNWAVVAPHQPWEAAQLLLAFPEAQGRDDPG